MSYYSIEWCDLNVQSHWRTSSSTNPEYLLTSSSYTSVFTGVVKGIEYNEITLKELLAAKEAYSIGGGTLVPIISINDQKIGQGKPGAVFLELGKLV